MSNRPVVKREDGKVWLADLEPCPSEDFGVLFHHCTKYVQPGVSEAWVTGANGGAFEMCVYRESLCESGPTRQGGGGGEGFDAWRALGVAMVGDWSPAPGFEEFRPRIFKKFCEHIDGGCPGLGWDLASTLLYGYDEDGHFLYYELDGTPAKVHHTEIGNPEMGYCTIEIFAPCEPADPRTIVPHALAGALTNATGVCREDASTCSAGLAGYNAWIAALSADEKPHHGRCAFYADHYSRRRRIAVEFLREAKEKIADEKLDPLFDEAMELYDEVASNLERVAELFPVIHGNTAPVHDGPAVQQAIPALTAARDAEAKGLQALAKLASAMGADEDLDEKLSAALTAKDEGED